MKRILVILLVVGSISLVAFSFRNTIKSRYSAMQSRPIIGNDFGELKFVYRELFQHNSQTFKLAGRPEFPINTETLYPITATGLTDLSQKLRSELLFQLAYDAKEPALTNRRTLSVRTNQWQQLSTEQKRISGLTLKSVSPLTDVKVDLLPKPPQQVHDASLAQRSLRLFNLFLSLRRRGVSPLGANYRIPFDEFTTVYGYGQCHNQAYALADLFQRHGISTRLVEINKPSHTLVEAQVSPDTWALFDPMLAHAFIDNNGSLNFAQVRTDIDTAFQKFGIDDSEALTYYKGDGITTEPFVASAAIAEPYTFSLREGQDVEYRFAASYPWITKRNLTPPPPEVLGYLRMFWGENTNFDIRTPFPLVEAEVSMPQEGTTLSADNREVAYDPTWKWLRLGRYLNHQRQLQLASSKPVRLVTVSQFSSLPYYRMTDGFIRVSAASDSLVEVSVDYFPD